MIVQDLIVISVVLCVITYIIMNNYNNLNKN